MTPLSDDLLTVEAADFAQLLRPVKVRRVREERETRDVPHLIDVPDIRQRDHFSCGACAAMCVGCYFGVGPDALDEWKDALGTTEQRSTSPQAIISYLLSLGLHVEGRHDLDLETLAACWRAGTPVICPCQDYMPERPKQAEWDYGHYLTFIGGPALGLLFFQDSSEDNVTKGSGSIAAKGRVMIEPAKWLDLWHDVGEDGEKYVHFGIIVGKPGQRPAIESRERSRSLIHRLVTLLEEAHGGQFKKGGGRVEGESTDKPQKLPRKEKKRAAKQSARDTEKPATPAPTHDKRATDLHAEMKPEFEKHPELKAKAKSVAVKTTEFLSSVAAKGAVLALEPDFAGDLMNDFIFSSVIASQGGSTLAVKAIAIGASFAVTKIKSLFRTKDSLESREVIVMEGWVTMGKKSGGGDEEKHGGTHVFLGKGGRIEKGPAGMKGKKPSELPHHKVTATHGDKHPVTKDKEGPKEKSAETVKTVPAATKPATAATSKPTADAKTFTKASDRPAATALAKETHGEWAKKLGDSGKQALETYTGESYKNINSALRKGDNSEPIVKHLDEAINTAPPLPPPTTLYRGIGSGLLDKLKDGVEFTDKAFVSSSSNLHTAEQFASDAIIEMKIPPGTKAAAMDALDRAEYQGDKSENEYLLGRNAKFKVTGRRRDPERGDIVTVELVSHGE